MLIFNCTGAADDFFSILEKGKRIPRSQRPSSSGIGEDAESLACQDGSTRQLSQWVVHAIKVKRKSVLLAMHAETRYCMVFVGIKRGDLGAFVQRFFERWLNEMQRFGMKLGVLREAELPLIVTRFMSVHGDFQLLQRGDRSVQTHVNEVLRQFRGFVEDFGSFPEDDLEAAAFDDWANDTPRSTKTSKDYFFPCMVMFEAWLRQFCDASDERVAEAGQRWLAWQRATAGGHPL